MAGSKMDTHASAPFYRERRRSAQASGDRAEKQAARRAKKPKPFVGMTVHVNANGHDFTVETYPSEFLIRGNVEYESLVLGHCEPRVQTTGLRPMPLDKVREYAAGLGEAIAYASGEKPLPDLEDA